MARKSKTTPAASVVSLVDEIWNAEGALECIQFILDASQGAEGPRERLRMVVAGTAALSVTLERVRLLRRVLQGEADAATLLARFNATAEPMGDEIVLVPGARSGGGSSL